MRSASAAAACRLSSSVRDVPLSRACRAGGEGHRSKLRANKRRCRGVPKGPTKEKHSVAAGERARL